MVTFEVQTLYTLKVRVALLQKGFTAPKSRSSGAMTRHVGPTEVVSGTETTGFVGELTLKVSAPL